MQLKRLWSYEKSTSSWAVILGTPTTSPWRQTSRTSFHSPAGSRKPLSTQSLIASSSTCAIRSVDMLWRSSSWRRQCSLKTSRKSSGKTILASATSMSKPRTLTLRRERSTSSCTRGISSTGHSGRLQQEIKLFCSKYKTSGKTSLSFRLTKRCESRAASEHYSTTTSSTTCGASCSGYLTPTSRLLSRVRLGFGSNFAVSSESELHITFQAWKHFLVH